MNKDDKSTSRSRLSVWEELYKIRFWIAVVAVLVSTLAYALLWFLNPSNTSNGFWWVFLPAAGRDYLMALITNFVPTFLIIVVGYVLFRKLQAIKSKEERDALVAEITEGVQLVVAGELQNAQQKIDEILKHNELGYTFRSLGVAGVTADWTDYIYFKGPIGTSIKKHLEHAEYPTTWYIVSISPEAFISWLGPIKRAVERRGVNVKWVSHVPESVKADDALKIEWEWLMSRLPNYKDRSSEEGMDDLTEKVAGLRIWAKQSTQEIQHMDEQHRSRAGTWELFASRAPHFYMAFLSVPGIHKEMPIQAPAGTFGFVVLYPKFPREYESRSALYLEEAGEILNYYYWSTVQLFNEGIKRGYLWCTWPQETLS